MFLVYFTPIPPSRTNDFSFLRSLSLFRLVPVLFRIGKKKGKNEAASEALTHFGMTHLRDSFTTGAASCRQRGVVKAGKKIEKKPSAALLEDKEWGFGHARINRWQFPASPFSKTASIMLLSFLVFGRRSKLYFYNLKVKQSTYRASIIPADTQVLLLRQQMRIRFQC